MTHKYWIVTCDHCGKESGPIDGHAKQKEARELVGWYHFWSKDYCPKCEKWARKQWPALTEHMDSIKAITT
jgi:hypothetical protein